jgi:hypothetical protein
MIPTGLAIVSRLHGVKRAAVRAAAAALLAAVALVPSIARAHDKLCADRTPSHQHSRFRWANSCESVPKKASAPVSVAPVEAPAVAAVEPPRTWCDALAVDAPLPAPLPVPSPPLLRAPPAASL